MSVVQDRKGVIFSTKQQFIVDTTVILIENIGIDKIRMEDIAYASNYTKRTLYTYFKSKDEIFLWAFTDDLIKRWNFQLVELEQAKTGLEKLNRWADSLFEYYSANPHALQIQQFMDYHFISIEKVSKTNFKRFEEINKKLADGLRNIFRLGIEDGSFRKNVEIDITISQFLYSYRAILSRAFSDSYSFSKFDKQTYVKHFQQLFTFSLKG